MDANWFFQGAGDLVPLNVWVPEHTIDQARELHNKQSIDGRTEVIKMSRNEQSTDDHNSNKYGGIDLKQDCIPNEWGIPPTAKTAGSLTYNTGDYLYPHRDKWGMVNPDGTFKARKSRNGVRLFNFLNKTSPTEFHFVYDGKITVLEERRWYAVNTQRVHYGFSFVDEVFHLGCELRFDDDVVSASSNFLLSNMEYQQPFHDRKGVDCTRN